MMRQMRRDFALDSRLAAALAQVQEAGITPGAALRPDIETRTSGHGVSPTPGRKPAGRKPERPVD